VGIFIGSASSVQWSLLYFAWWCLARRSPSYIGSAGQFNCPVFYLAMLSDPVIAAMKQFPPPPPSESGAPAVVLGDDRPRMP